MKNDQEEFYIGWQNETPPTTKRRLRVFVLALALVVIAVGFLIVRSQQGFSNATFELGRITELEGVLIDRPVPFLQVYRGLDPQGHPIMQHIVLVGAGKHGAHEAIMSAEKTAGKTLNGQVLRISGSLIYHDGQTLMEISKKPDSIIPITQSTQNEIPAQQEKSIGQVDITGEIIDPKCYFGAMKPGYGKTHRACAVRCIAGGIPPVFKTSAPDGSTRYYLIVGHDGQPVNDEVLPFVADQVSLQGELRQLGDWYILYKNETQPQRLSAKQ